MSGTLRSWITLGLALGAGLALFYVLVGLLALHAWYVRKFGKL